MTVYLVYKDKTIVLQNVIHVPKKDDEVWFDAENKYLKVYKIALDYRKEKITKDVYNVFCTQMTAYLTEI